MDVALVSNMFLQNQWNSFSDEEEQLLSQPKINKALNLLDSLKRVRVSIVKKGV